MEKRTLGRKKEFKQTNKEKMKKKKKSWKKILEKKKIK
jgi:hypothetical protein